MSSVVLGVDFGTSHTVAVLRRGDAAGVPLLFDGSPLLPSAVYAEEDGRLLTGRDAVHSARLRPERFEPNPKRRVDDATVLLGDNEVPVVTLFAEVLAHVKTEAERVAGTPPSSTVVTHPATWGPVRRLVLTDACAQAGLGEVTLVPEPVAAARYFASQSDTAIAPGQAVVVYDFGGGTFDATVLTANETDFEVLAVDGADDLGGVDIDHALAEHIAQNLDRDERATALMRPTDVTGRRHFRTFMDYVRATKERLSRQTRVDLLIPGLDTDTHLTREELEAVCEPLLGKAVRLTAALMRSTGVPQENIAGMFLVGGASRMPLAATTLHRGIGIAPTVIDQPEIVVASGATLDTTKPGLAPEPAPAAPMPAALYQPPATQRQPAPPSATPPSAVPTTPPRQPAPRPAPVLKALHWTQFTLLTMTSLTTFFSVIFGDYPLVLLSGVLLPGAFAVVTAINATWMSRDPARSRRTIMITQTAILGYSVVCIFIFQAAVPSPPLPLFLAAFTANAVILLGLTALSYPPDFTPQWRGFGPLRATLITQLAMLLVIVPLLLWWWADLFTNTPGRLDRLDSEGTIAVFAVLFTTLTAFAMLATGIPTAFAQAPISMVRKAGIYGSQGLWLLPAVWYPLPWLYEDYVRFLPPYLTGGTERGTMDVGGHDRPWDNNALLFSYNMTALWLTVIIGALAVVVITQLRRMPADLRT